MLDYLITIAKRLKTDDGRIYWINNLKVDNLIKSKLLVYFNLNELEKENKNGQV